MWARCVAAGVPDGTWAQSTPGEVAVLLEELGDRQKALQRADNLRAGVIAAAFVNIWRKKGSRPVKPMDFFRERRRLTPEQFRDMMLGWAEDMRAGGKAVAISTREIEA